MKKVSVVLFFLIIFCVSLFSNVILKSPAINEKIDSYPVCFEWENTELNTEKVPYTYSIYIGESKENMKLLVNNMIELKRSIYDLSEFKNQKLFWKIVLQYTNGTFVESDVHSFTFTKIYTWEKIVKIPEELKIILNWKGSALDLDIHFTGSLPNGEYFHMFRALSEKTGENKWQDYVKLEQFNNREVLTLKKPNLETTYRLSVRDYTNKDKTLPKEWKSANAYLEIYYDGNLIKTITVPATASGVFWNVMDIIVDAYGDIKYTNLDKFTDYYSSVSAFGLEEGFTPPIRNEIPVGWKSEVPLKVINVDKSELKDILPAMGIELDINKIDAIKLVLPAGVKLDDESVSVFVKGKPSGFIVRESEMVKVSTDIMFVLDTSGSMSDAIDGVKESLKAFISYLNIIGLDVHTGVVPFDDGVPARAIRKAWKNLSELESTSNYIGKLYADGGDDTPENPYTAIAFAYNNADWRLNSEKILVLLTDAPGHDPSDRGDAGSGAKYYKNDVIKMIKGHSVLHSILSPGYFEESDRYFNSSDDPREISVQTDGIIAYTKSNGKVDLTKSGILSIIENSYFVMFENPEGSLDDVEIIFETSEGMGDSREYTK